MAKTRRQSVGQISVKKDIRSIDIGDRLVQKVTAIKVSVQQCGTRVSVSISMVQSM